MHALLGLIVLTIFVARDPPTIPPSIPPAAPPASEQATPPATREITRTEAVVAALTSSVTIELDRVDVPTIRASSMEDAACAQGWLHARERFLQMDLTRREPAGELAQLIAQGIAMDRLAAPLQLRAVARRALSALPENHRVLLERYASGVNAQLAQLTPLEYQLLKATPAPWLAEDSLLVQLSMARYLDSSAATDRARALLFAELPLPLAEYFDSSHGVLDMSVDGSLLPAPYEIPNDAIRIIAAAVADEARAVHAADEHEPNSGLKSDAANDAMLDEKRDSSIDTSSDTSNDTSSDTSSETTSETTSDAIDGIMRAPSIVRDEAAWTRAFVSPLFPAPNDDAVPGSNAFAVAGSRTKDGRAIVGNDMHLALMAPGFWYRVALEFDGTRLVGLSLPGVPMIAQGTNGHVAWAFSNLTADLSDLVIIEPDPADATRYLTSEGSEAFVQSSVAIGREALTPLGRETLTLRNTRFGPIVETRADGTMLALRWAPLLEGALDLALFDLAHAKNLDSALDVAKRWHGPPQNILIADSTGRIGWTIAGVLPKRSALTRVPVLWRDAPQWNGLFSAHEKPSIVDPTSGVLTSGNQLALAPQGALAMLLGCNEVAGDRAHRLRTLLEERTNWNEADLYAVQLDVHSERLLRWRDAIVALLGACATTPECAQGVACLVQWDGLVSIESTAPVILDALRRRCAEWMCVAVANYAQRDESVDQGPDQAHDQAHDQAPDQAADQGVVSPRTAEMRAQLGVALRGSFDDEAVLRLLEVCAESSARVNGERDAPLWTKESAAQCSTLAARLLSEAVAAARNPQGELMTRGSVNRLVMRHPAADALGAAARMAEMPRTALPGHPSCVRVQTPNFGASERSVISPAHLDDAILVTPAGQSGSPLSPHFKSLHRYWQEGLPFPLLPGEAVRVVELSPKVVPTAP